MNKGKLLKRLSLSQANVRFSEFCTLVEAFGFKLARVAGSHHIFVHRYIPELINLQDVKGEAKLYQIRHFWHLSRNSSCKSENRMKDYHINIFYIGDIPDLRHCSAFGNTPNDALREVLKAKKAWIAAVKKNGKPVPKPRFRPAIYQASAA